MQYSYTARIFASAIVVAVPLAACQSGSGDVVTQASSRAEAAAAAAGTGAECASAALKLKAYQAARRPAGTGTGAVIVEFTNVSKQPCILRGHPSVAGAGNGSTQRSTALKVTRTGSPSTVRLAPRARAWVKLTFVQVQGEGPGYCLSGAEPSVYPALLIGLPRSGTHRVALTDGRIAECDNKVTTTAVSAVKPS
ncbi:DUF4232 domain-containing protein [Streptomyces sp. NPDC049837]|uniref:DUF4232 domain-containing protein n=1 Tax=Streptomyces sp. NPDC049837 TaxID=3155277 RepID=UPI00341633C6